jgi:hypothetical protein
MRILNTVNARALAVKRWQINHVNILGGGEAV